MSGDEALLTLPFTAHVDGKKWHLYVVEWNVDDGKFSSHFYAISDEHAQLVTRDIRDTATVSGRLNWGGVKRTAG